MIPACLLPFDQDLAIDERAYRSHLEDLLAVDGITAITTNAHASEVHALSFDEQRRVLALTKETARRSGRDRGRRVHQRQPRGGADRAHGPRRGRGLPAGLPARHDGVGRAHAARDGPRAFFAHHRCERSADHPVPVSAGLAADVPLADLAGALPALSPDPRDQGFLRRRQAARAPHPRARSTRPAGERAEHAQRLADELAWCSAATACCRAPAA